MSSLCSLARGLWTGLAGVALAATALTSPAALANPAEDALAEVRGDTVVHKDVVQNRFFKKSNRFEIAPVLGTVPNNPMVKRYVGGVLVAYHLSETFAVGGQLLYSPDLGKTDLKGLTNTLVVIAHNAGGGSDPKFQQPLDKMVLGATFSGNWIPVYGKINLIGETVLNFDLYGSLGLGMLVINKYAATFDEEAARAGDPVPVALESRNIAYRVPANLALGADFFLTQSLAVKFEGRSYLYIDRKPAYDPDNPPSDMQLYNTFMASVGVSMYFPKMDDRRTEF